IRSVAKSGKSENGQIAVNSDDVNSISMRLPTYSYSNVSSGWRFISSFGVERISSCVSGVTSRRGGNFLPALAFTARLPLNFEFLFANANSSVITPDDQLIATTKYVPQVVQGGGCFGRPRHPPPWTTCCTLLL